MGLIDLDHFVLDTPDHHGLARFYADLLGWEVIRADEDWATIRPDAGSDRAISFQLAPDFVAPTWPDPSVPQQAHIDFVVDEYGPAEAHALALGARPTDVRESGFRAYLDPSGHPFCLCLRNPPEA